MSAATITGRSVEAGDGMLHIEAREGVTCCGRSVTVYPLHWATETVIGCGRCLMAAGVRRSVGGGTPK